MFDWLQNLSDWPVYSVFNIVHGTTLADALNFFVYDTIKILILLFLITSIMGVVNSYFPVDKIRNYLSRNKLFGLEYLFASTFGAITPFCSCSSVPLFMGFVKGGIPLGVTFSFLITSPLVNEVAIAMFIGMFGLKATLIYVFTGILLGIIGAVLAIIGLVILAFYIDGLFPTLGIAKDYVSIGIVAAGVLLVGIVITWVSTYFATTGFLNLRTDDLY